MFRCYRHRRVIVFVALFGLLFQHLAMAAYWCPQVDQELQALLLEDSGPQACHEDVAVDKARCHEHCHPTVPSADHVSALSVPSLLPCLLSDCTPQVATFRHGTGLQDPADRAHPPPVSIGFCSFQI